MTEPIARSRRESRERAIELGYEAAVCDRSVDEVIDGLVVAPDPFTVDLLRGAEDHRERADELIGTASTRWSLSRMAVLDLVIMRQAVAELLGGETPVGVVLSQAVELAGRYSTEESSRFVNGILSTVASRLDEGQSAES